MEPDDVARHHDVVAAAIVRGDRVLLCHRHPARKWYPNVWDVAGGHIDPGELPIDALVRELHEELGIDVDASRAVSVFRSSPKPDLDIEIWAVASWSGHIVNAEPDEHDELRWFTVDELHTVDLADPDVATACRMAIELYADEQQDVSQASTAALSVASELGLNVEDAIVLQDANRFVVRLVPCNVVARIAPPVRGNHDVAAFELEIAQRFEDADSPVGVLEPRVAPVPYVRDGFTITFWEYYEPVGAGETRPAEYAQALERLHAGMRQLDMTAPHFTDRVDEAQTIVDDRTLSPELVDADRELLSTSLRTLRRSVIDRVGAEQLLHGEPHPGNLLDTATGPRFIDFETCCRGPVEFDVAHAPDEVGDHYAAIDPVLLRDCRILMLAMVAAWRSERDDEFPNGREMRHDLLTKLRAAVTET